MHKQVACCSAVARLGGWALGPACRSSLPACHVRTPAQCHLTPAPDASIIRVSVPVKLVPSLGNPSKSSKHGFLAAHVYPSSSTRAGPAA